VVVQAWVRRGGVATQGSGGHRGGAEEDLMDVAVYATGVWGGPDGWVLGHPAGRRLVLLWSGVSCCDSEPVRHRVPGVPSPGAFL